MARREKDAVMAAQAAKQVHLMHQMGLSPQEALMASDVANEVLDHVNNLCESRWGRSAKTALIAKAAIAVSLQTMQSGDELLIAEKPELARYIR